SPTRRLPRHEVPHAAGVVPSLPAAWQIRHHHPAGVTVDRHRPAALHDLDEAGDRARRVGDSGGLSVLPQVPLRDGNRMTATPPSGEPFVVELQQFEGPLDLLLTLIRDEKVDIYDIPIARIAEQFLARIRTLAIDQAAEYLEMAARLLRIKAQMLLPRNQDDESWEDPRAELVRRLLEYQQVREISDHLARMAEERRSRFARSWLPSQSIEPPPAPLSLSLGALVAAGHR